MKKIILVFGLIILFSQCSKKQDPYQKLFTEAEALDSKIIESVSTISFCKANYEKILAEAPESEYAPLACFKLGKLNEVFGHYQKAVDFYRKFMTVFPQHELHAEALFNVAQIYFDHLDQAEKAGDTFSQLNYFFPKSEFKAKSLVRLGEIASRDELWEDAVKYFQQAANEFPDNELADDLCFRTGDILQNKIQNKAEAIKVYENLLKKYPGSSWCQFVKTRVAELNKGDQP